MWHSAWRTADAGKILAPSPFFNCLFQYNKFGFTKQAININSTKYIQMNIPVIYTCHGFMHIFLITLEQIVKQSLLLNLNYECQF